MTALAKTETRAQPAGAVDQIRQIMQWIIAGHTEADIAEAAAATWPKVKAKPLIIKALAEIAAQGQPDKDLVKGFAIEGTRTIYQRALEVGDHEIALRALKQLVELSR
jgi:hypothetical protein